MFRPQIKNELTSNGLSQPVDNKDSHDYPTLSLFEQTRQKKHNFITNIVIIGRLRDTWDKQPELGEYYQKMFDGLQNVDDFQVDDRDHIPTDNNATGLLLIFPTLFVHYLEVTSEALQTILQDVNSMIHDGNGLIKEASILNMSYNINMRLYPNWSYKSIKLAVEDLDAQPAETVEAIAIEILGKLLKLGRHIAEEKRRAVDKVTDVVAQIDLSRPDLLPNQANVNYLLKQPIFQTADTVLNNYKRPINIRFESDLTWPPTHRLFPTSY